jgi:hypothetical protein
MAAQLEFFDMSVSVTPPTGHLEPLPLTLGPNWQPNDIRLLFVSASGSESGASGGTVALDEIGMSPDPPTGFTSAYSRSLGVETHGVYFRRLVSGDNDTGVFWTKPPGWLHFIFATLTVRGVSPTTNPAAGTLSGWWGGAQGITYITADTTTSATVSSVSVPSAGSMVFCVGDVAAPTSGSPWPNWPVSLGCPTGWANLVATPASGDTYFPYDTNPAVAVVAKSYATSGSTGSVTFPAGLGAPLLAGLYAFITPAADVSVSLGAA